MAAIHNPTPEQIRERCAECRTQWTPGVEERRRVTGPCPVKALDETICELGMLEDVECPLSSLPRAGRDKGRKRKRKRKK